MTELRDVQGYSPSIPGTASARNCRLGGQIFRGNKNADVSRCVVRRQMIARKFETNEGTHEYYRPNKRGVREEIARLREPRRLALNGAAILITEVWVE
jgi:hypothetical protein